MRRPPLPAAGEAATVQRRQVYLHGPLPVDCRGYRREILPAGARIEGPALIQESATTTVLFEQDVCRVAETGELVVAVGGR
jgi:N-methylhydantoinase A